MLTFLRKFIIGFGFNGLVYKKINLNRKLASCIISALKLLKVNSR